MRYTYTAGLELFMQKLKQLITFNYNPLINNHPSVLTQMPQFQLLYDTMIQTLILFNNEHHRHHQLQQVKDLQKRFKDAAEEAQDIVDLFLYNINLENHISKVFKDAEEDPPTSKRCEGGCCSVCGRSKKLVKKEEISMNLEDVMTSIKSIEEGFIKIHNNMKMDSDQKPEVPSAAEGGTCYTKSALRTKISSSEDIVVGFDRHAELIRDKLVEDQKQLDVISIVGMGGLGKTTLATKVFNDPFVIYHFHLRGCVTVSQTYEKKDLLIQILESIGIKLNNVRKHDYPQLRQMLRKNLIGKRYLIVIDDIWSVKAWDDLKLSFPDDHTRSRILLTSRLKEVVSHAKPHGFIHQLEYLTDEESWELLCMKVFRGSNVCPKWLIEPGKKIARNCHGLPLTLVVVAGVLVKEAKSKDSWERIGRSVSSYIVSGETEYIKQLALSFDHLPGHLRDCFLYLGGFPEDYKFRVQLLMRLWMAEGFIQEDGIHSLEEIGENCLMELVDRNLVVVANRKSNGGIKAFYVHDLLRELCLKIATEKNFYLKADYKTHSIEACKQRRLFIQGNIIITNAPKIRSFVCVYRHDDTRNLIKENFHFLMLLMVLDLRYMNLKYFPEEISRLVHLRYLAISYNRDQEFPSSICKLWSLQTLIVRRYLSSLKLPKTISNLVNLRHLILESRHSYITFPAIQKPMNLQMISRVELVHGAESWMKCFLSIKRLSCHVQTNMECDFKSLTSLENLKLSGNEYVRRELKFIGFPPSLNSLTLERCCLRWSNMSIIQSLPNLEVLKLIRGSFVGSRWDAGEEPFRQLKVLKLCSLNLIEWEASNINFPCLTQLVLERCYFLKEIPLDIGYIPTLELISISYCNESVMDSLETIKEEQHAQGNFDLKITFKNSNKFIVGKL